MTKMKTSADDKINVDKMTISHFDRIENTVRKGENVGHQHFLLFSLVFSRAIFYIILKLNNSVHELFIFKIPLIAIY